MYVYTHKLTHTQVINNSEVMRQVLGAARGVQTVQARLRGQRWWRRRREEIDEEGRGQVAGRGATEATDVRQRALVIVDCAPHALRKQRAIKGCELRAITSRKGLQVYSNVCVR